MAEDVFFDTLRQGLWVALLMSAPVLGVALVTGLVIGLFQALTSIQEMTLTFVPKMVALLVTFWASMSFMTGLLTSYFVGTIVPLIAGS